MLNKLLNILTYLSLAILMFIVAYIIARCLLVDSFYIPSTSMKPTLMPGSRIVVDKTIMGARIYKNFNFNDNNYKLEIWRTRGRKPIKHNDLVVYNRVNYKDKIKFVINDVYCKRIIGLPGDTIRIINGHYTNNNYNKPLGIHKQQNLLQHTPDSTLEAENLLRSMPKEEHFNWTIKNFGPLYIPRKGDVIHITPETATVFKTILEWETNNKILIDWDENKVMAKGVSYETHCFKHNYYFMGGDNVLNSNDSRYMGVVPEEYIIGVVSFVVPALTNTHKYK